jgi:polyhydroxyalkanoate synthesis regulator phasin
MNPSEFKVAREQRLKIFEESYASLKQVYSEALEKSISETDRTKQCVVIKKALEINQKLTALVQEFLVGTDSGNCKVSPDRIRQLRQDMETYKSQYAEIQQGRDRIHALQKSLYELEDKVQVVRGVDFIYMCLLAFGVIILLLLMFNSGIRSAFNAYSVSPILSRSPTQSSYF